MPQKNTESLLFKIAPCIKFKQNFKKTTLIICFF